jgi:hypothetical protein
MKRAYFLFFSFSLEPNHTMQNSNPLLRELAEARSSSSSERPPAVPSMVQPIATHVRPSLTETPPTMNPPHVVARDEAGRPLTAALLAANREARRAAAETAAKAVAPASTSLVAPGPRGHVLGGAPAPVRPPLAIASPVPAAPPAVLTSRGFVLGGSLPPIASQGISTVPAVPIENHLPGSGEAMLAAMRSKEAAEKAARDSARADVLRARKMGQLRPATRGFGSGAGPG